MSNLDFHPRAKLTDSIDISTLVSMRNQGMTNKQIAESLGVSVATVTRYLPKKRIYKIGQDTRTGIVRAYKRKKQIKEIALMFSVSRASVVTILRDAGVTKDSKYAKRLTDKVKKDIVRYRDLGWSMKKISEVTGFGYWAIHEYLKKLKCANAPVRLDGTPDIKAVEEEEKRETLQEQLQALIDNGQATVNEEGVMVPVDIPSKKVLKIENKTVQINGEYFSFSVDNDSVIAVAIDEEHNRRDCLYIPKSKIRDAISELTELADMIERGDV